MNDSATSACVPNTAPSPTDQRSVPIKTHQPSVGVEIPLRYSSLERGEIRLVYVHRDLSPDGLIQCSMEHAPFISTEYRCLSYVWGPPGSETQIKINGQIAWVRPNLHAFLKVAREKYAFILLWIDALCIDQENNPERDHQVQEMGKIYSQARMVISWLGDNEELSSGLKALRRKLKPNLLNPFPQDFYSLPRYREPFPLLTTHEYWTRAWIVQEISLARSVVLMTSGARFNIDLLPDGWFSSFSHIGPLLSPHSSKTPESLLALLDRFRYKECSKPLDRVWSLLSVCAEDPGIVVDNTIPAWSLAIRVLEVSPTAICFCTLLVLFKVLQIHHMDIPEVTSSPEGGRRQDPQPLLELFVDLKPSLFAIWCTHKHGGHSLALHSVCDSIFGRLRYVCEGEEGCSVQYFGNKQHGPIHRLKTHGDIRVVQDAAANFCSWRFSLRAIAEILEYKEEFKSDRGTIPRVKDPNDGYQTCCLREDSRGCRFRLYWPD